MEGTLLVGALEGNLRMPPDTSSSVMHLHLGARPRLRKQRPDLLQPVPGAMRRRALHSRSLWNTVRLHLSRQLGPGLRPRRQHLRQLVQSELRGCRVHSRTLPRRRLLLSRTLGPGLRPRRHHLRQLVQSWLRECRVLSRSMHDHRLIPAQDKSWNPASMTPEATYHPPFRFDFSSGNPTFLPERCSRQLV